MFNEFTRRVNKSKMEFVFCGEIGFGFYPSINFSYITNLYSATDCLVNELSLFSSQKFKVIYLSFFSFFSFLFFKEKEKNKEKT